VTLFAREASYREVASAVAPVAVSQFLAAKGWELEASQDNVKEIWRLPDGQGGVRGRILLPLATDYIDFPQRFADALHAISKLNGWSPEELLEQIITA